MSQVCFERIGQQKQHNFDEKTRFGNGMNLLGEPHGNLTKGLLNSLTQAFLIGSFPSLIRPLAIVFSLNFQRNLFTISIQFLLFIVRI